MPFLPIYDSNPRVYISRPYVVWGLIALNVLGFVWQTSGGDLGFQTVVYRYGFIPAVFGGGAELPPGFGAAPSALTLITSQFLHGDLFHLVFNMLFLWDTGSFSSSISSAASSRPWRTSVSTSGRRCR